MRTNGMFLPPIKLFLPYKASEILHFLVAKRLVAKCPVAKCLVAKRPVAKCPGAKFVSFKTSRF